MARTGDEEGEGQEAQEGSRRLILRSRTSTFPIRVNVPPLLSHVPSISHARNMSFRSSLVPSLFSNAVFPIPLSFRSIHHTSKVHRTLSPRSSAPSIASMLCEVIDPHLF